MDTITIVAICRLIISICGLLIIASYKMIHGYRRYLENQQRKATDTSGTLDELNPINGLPENKGIFTLWEVAKMGYQQPNRGAWIVGHVTCMASSFVGTLYIFAEICINGINAGTSPSDASWVYAAIEIRNIGTIIVIPFCAIQLLLISLGHFARHRWLGRMIVHWWLWTSFASLSSMSTYTGFIIGAVVLGLEAAGYFGYKYMKEKELGIHRSRAHRDSSIVVPGEQMLLQKMTTPDPKEEMRDKEQFNDLENPSQQSPVAKNSEMDTGKKVSVQD